MSKPYPADVIQRLKAAVSAWKTIDPALTIGKMSLADLEATLKRCEALRQEITALEARLINLRNQRDEAYSAGWRSITRMRAGIKAIYGDDSSEYEIAGGTRRSERKPRSRRSKSGPA